MVSESSTGLYEKFRIVVEFVAPGKAVRYRCEMMMPGSQNKSEYQIIRVMEYFSGKAISLAIL